VTGDFAAIAGSRIRSRRGAPQRTLKENMHA
jgi:hypothetical protein